MIHDPHTSCLICEEEVNCEEDECAKRSSDGSLVCPECYHMLVTKSAPGHLDAVDMWFNKRAVRT